MVQQRRRLAGAVRAQQRHDLARSDGQRQVAHDHGCGRSRRGGSSISSSVSVTPALPR